ncbi:pyruvate dehydrogenase E1 component domain protein [Mycobacterium xenopi 3993]|nr:pyruvate dehydrogenase E1 component domain protein [Mycobacterium xenopi 3993]
MTQISERLTATLPVAAQPLTMVQALNRALHDAMAADERVLVYGLDVAAQGGFFG